MDTVEAVRTTFRAEAPAPNQRVSSRDIFCLSSVDWDFLWQTNQSLAWFLAQHGYRVLFIENTGIRNVRLNDMPRLKQRIGNWLKSTKGFREILPGHLYVYAPLVLPFPYSRAARWINRRLLNRSLRRWMQVTEFHPEIFLTYLPSPLSLDLIEDFRPEMVIYYCKDNFAASAIASQKVLDIEEKLARRADLIFTTARILAERQHCYAEKVHYFPAGVEPERFSRPQPMPRGLSGVSRPIIGFAGALHENKFDRALMERVVRLRPNYSFVFLGPAYMELDALFDAPNVHWLGRVDHDDLPAYLQAFDVCVIPYVLNEYTKAIFPAKLPEYWGAGRPVVSSPLPELVALNGSARETLFFAEGPEAFAQALDRAVAGESSQRRDACHHMAQEYGWAQKAERIVELIEDAITQKQLTSVRLWSERLLAVYRRTRRLVSKFALGITLSYLMIFHTPLPWWLAAPLKVEQAPRAADAIVVLAGGVGESGLAGQGYEERVKYAVELYHAGYATRLIFSSGYVYAFNEPEVMKALAEFLGVPSEAIALETASKNTYEHVRNVKALLDAQGLKRILLVSSPYHMRRVSLVARRIDPQRTIWYTPVPRSLFYDYHGGTQLRHLKALCHEWLSLIYYWYRGYL